MGAKLPASAKHPQTARRGHDTVTSSPGGSRRGEGSGSGRDHPGSARAKTLTSLRNDNNQVWGYFLRCVPRVWGAFITNAFTILGLEESEPRSGLCLFTWGNLGRNRRFCRTLFSVLFF